MKAAPGFTPAKDAIAMLREYSEPAILSSIHRMSRLIYPSRAALILKELDPSEFATTCQAYRSSTELPQHTVEEYPYSYLLETAFSAIDRSGAPLDLDRIDTVIYDDSDNLSLYPMPENFPMSWDELDEITNDVEGLSDSWALYMFFKSLTFRDAALFSRCNDHFGWNCATPDLDDSKGFDWRRFCRLLEKHALADFIKVVETVDYDTGNFYMDYNPYDDSIDQGVPDFSLDGVRYLQEQYRASIPWREANERASQAVADDPTLWKTLLKDYAKCIVYAKKRRPATLAEVFTLDETDEGYEYD